jgi:hypothetical protein
VQSVQEPRPLPLQRPFASFLGDSLDMLVPNHDVNGYGPEPVDDFVSQWLESISGPHSYRQGHCRSDTFLGQSDGDLVSRRLTKSAPNLQYVWNAGGFALPTPTPASTQSFSRQEDMEDSQWASSYPLATESDIISASTGSSRSKKLVESPLYLDADLATNDFLPASWDDSSGNSSREHISSSSSRGSSVVTAEEGLLVREIGISDLIDYLVAARQR